MVEVPIVLVAILSLGGVVTPLFQLRRELSAVAPSISVALLSGSIVFLIGGLLLQPVVAAPLSPLLRADGLGLFFSLAVLLVSAFVAAASTQYLKDDDNAPVFHALLLFTTAGMVLLAFAVDLLMIIVAWELMSIPTFVLTGFRKRDPASNEAAVKFFILGAFSSGVLLYGASLVYGITGSTRLSEIVASMNAAIAEPNPLAFVALALFIAGFGLKMSIVPFHMWVPDAYEGAPTTVSALLSAGTKKAGFVAAVRVFAIALPLLKLEWTAAFAILAVITMTLGNVAALTQVKITRLLAYSSIAQAGYIAMGLAVAPYTTLGLMGVLLHVLFHAIMQSLAFIAAAAVVHATERADLDAYKGLGYRMPLTGLTLTISLLALAGVPPLNGFWSKLVLFTAAIEGGASVWWGPWLAAAGIINSAFSLAYYAWIIKRMYLDESVAGSGRIPELLGFRLVLAVAAVLIIATGVYPGPLFEFANMAAKSAY